MAWASLPKWRWTSVVTIIFMTASCREASCARSEHRRVARAADASPANASALSTAAAPSQNASAGNGQNLSTTVLSVDTAPCTADGHCVCTVRTSQAWAIDEQYRAILALRQRIEEVNVLVSGNLLQQLFTNVTLLQTRIDQLQGSLQTQSVVLSQTELNALRAELSLISTLIGQLELNVTTNLTATLRQEVGAIMASLTAIETNNPIAVQANLQQEINNLKERLARCRTETPSGGGATMFLGDTLPANEPYGVCPSARNITIGPEVTHRSRGWQGWWGKDPRPTNDTTRRKIYEIRTASSSSVSLTSWNNYSDFMSARAEYLQQSICGFPTHGRKNVIVNGSLYYFEVWYRSTVWKLDLVTCTATPLSMSVQASVAYITGETYADLNYDETGLYMTFTDSSLLGELAIAKIDPDTMTVIKTWATGRQKSTLANVFFVCGRMYTTDSYVTAHQTGKQFGFDTNTGEEFFIDLDVESRFGSVEMLSYNPRERLLFGFDGGHLVTYQVFFP